MILLCKKELFEQHNIGNIFYTLSQGVSENAVKVLKRIVLVWVLSIVSSIPWLFIAILRPSVFYDGTPIEVFPLF